MNASTNASLPRVDHPPAEALTYWDKVNLGRWGNYLSTIEESAVRRAHCLSTKLSSGIDLGCGSGRWSQLLSTLGWQMTCIDIDEDILSICRRNAPTAKVILTGASSQTIPGGDRTANLLLCIEAPLLDTNWFLPEADRVLEQDGLMLGVWWNSFSWRALAWRLNNSLTHRGGAKNFYTSTYSSWKKRLAAKGFEVLHEEGFCWGPFGRDSDSALIPLFTKMEKSLGFNRWVLCSPWVIFIARKTAVKN